MNSDDEDKRIRKMNAINAVRLFVAVWIFTTVCQADENGCRVSCDDVTGSVGKEVAFTCRVSLQCTDCCIKMYKFQSLEEYEDSTICRQELPEGSCDQKNIFTCSYIPTTSMTRPFRFFLQTTCEAKTTEIHVNITESIEPKIFTKVITPEKTEEHVWEVPETSKDEREEQKTVERGFKIAVIAAVVSSLIIIIVPVVYRITQKHPKIKRAFVVYRHDGDDCSHSENVII